MTTHEFARKLLGAPDVGLIEGVPEKAISILIPKPKKKRGRPRKYVYVDDAKFPPNHSPKVEQVEVGIDTMTSSSGPSPVLSDSNSETIEGLLSANKIEFEKLKELVVLRQLVKSQKPINCVSDFSPELLSMLVQHQAGWIGLLTGKRLLP